MDPICEQTLSKHFVYSSCNVAICKKISPTSTCTVVFNTCWWGSHWSSQNLHGRNTWKQDLSTKWWIILRYRGFRVWLQFLDPHSGPTIALMERKFLCRSITLPTAQAAVTRDRAQTEQSSFPSLPWRQSSSDKGLKLSAQTQTCIKCPERGHALLNFHLINQTALWQYYCECSARKRYWADIKSWSVSFNKKLIHIRTKIGCTFYNKIVAVICWLRIYHGIL